MNSSIKYLAAAILAGGLAVPAAAQYPQYPPYPQQYPQQYPPYGGYPGQTYPGQPYGGNVIDNVINQLLGNRYNVTDRQAVSRCARAAVAQAENQYRGYGQGYGQGYGGGYGGYPQSGYNQGIARPGMRVTAITDVQRRSSGLRVRGLIDTGLYRAQPYGYQNQGYGDLNFRCNVDYNGAVTGVRIGRNDNQRRY